MLPEQQTVSATTDPRRSVIDRVLHLRRQLGIALPLTLIDLETLPTPIERRGISPAVSTSLPGIDGRGERSWLVWSQSPRGEIE